MTHNVRKPGSLFWCYALMSLQITHVRSYACRGRWSNLGAVYSVGFYCITITRQQIFKGSLQVTVESVLPHVTIEKHTFCRYTAARGWLLIAVSHAFLYCVKKHELICSNASTSLKKSIASVRLSVIKCLRHFGRRVNSSGSQKAADSNVALRMNISAPDRSSDSANISKNVASLVD